MFFFQEAKPSAEDLGDKKEGEYIKLKVIGQVSSFTYAGGYFIVVCIYTLQMDHFSYLHMNSWILVLYQFFDLEFSPKITFLLTSCQRVALTTALYLKASKTLINYPCNFLASERSIIIPVLQMGNWWTEKLSDLFEVIQEVCNRW